MEIRVFKTFANLILCVVICSCEFNASNLQTRPRPIWNATYTDKLKQDLLLNYDKFSRPSQHYNVTTLEIGITVLHLDIDEFKSTFNVNCWVQMYWNDDKLKWKSQDYGGLRQVNFAEHEIWQPDIMLYNSALGSPSSHPTGTHCVVRENGSVIWVPAANLVALCQLNLKYWPFDTQKCTLKFGSWTYDGYNVDIQLVSTPLVIEESMLSGEWSIIKMNYSRHSKIYPCCEEPYPDTEFEFTLGRRSYAFKDTIIALAFVIIALTLLVFWLPPQAGEKILLNGFIAVIISIFMIYFTQKVPIHVQMPLIVMFYSKSLYLVGFSMLESIAVIWISRTTHCKPLSPKIKRLATGWLGRLLCLKLNTKKEVTSRKINIDDLSDPQSTEMENKSSDNDCTIPDYSAKSNLHEDWVLLANALDRIMFVLYCFVFIILAFVHAL